MSQIKLRTVTGEALGQYTEELAALRIEVFRQFPYLYDGSLDYEKNYIRTYAESRHSAVVLAFDGDKVVGASTCIPLQDEGENIRQAFQHTRYSTEDGLYLGESVLQKAYRGQGIGVKFFEHREQHAQQLGLRYTAFCAVVRPADHPLKPEGYRSLHSFWQHRGYQQHPQMRATMAWKDIDQPKETTKELIFWIKLL